MVPEPGQRGPSPPGEAALQAKIADHPKAATSMKKKDSTTTIRDSIRTGSVKADGQDSVDVIESDTTVVE
jgi:hypothetical protein